MNKKKLGEAKERTTYDLMNNNSWMTEVKNYEEWKKKEEKFIQNR